MIAFKKMKSRFNGVLMSGAGRTRLFRLGIALRSAIWKMRCKMQIVIKRVIDFSGAGIGLIILSPLLLGVMAIIKLSSPGPIFYSQIRVGYRGKGFRMWKFRSMYIDADARKAALEAQNEMAGGVLFKMKNDPRITPIGRIIRRLSIDELPQLFNVVRGDMSLVGPRPALESEVAQYPVLARARLEAIPGLTGLWQISGRSDLPFDKQVLLDTTYVHTQSTSNDIKIIAKTIPAVVSGKGAY
jgi:lipopolysaccharide/colanic/teichoic acid biosynthesis glycosyltransferase